jgi:hypothetical protein
MRKGVREINITAMGSNRLFIDYFGENPARDKVAK